MLFNLWLEKTDSFLCHNIRNSFEKVENSYKDNNQNINLFEELKHLQSDPLVSTSMSSSKFEKDVKMKLKLIVGIFFVFIPLVSFILLSYIVEVPFTYAILSTVVVAVFASVRMDKTAQKYSDFRHSLI